MIGDTGHWRHPNLRDDDFLSKDRNRYYLDEHLRRYKDIVGQKSHVQYNDLAVILKAFTRRGQHRLTKAFFDLNPTKQQIHSAKKIWSFAFQLKHRLLCRTFPRIFNSFDDLLDDQNIDLRKKVIDKDTKSMMVSRRRKTIGLLKLDMMTTYISTAEATARGHARRAKVEKEKWITYYRTSTICHQLQSVFFRRNSDVASRMNWQQRRSTHTNTSLASPNYLLPSSAIVEVATSFTDKHLSMLAQGPKYVSKCLPLLRTV